MFPYSRIIVTGGAGFVGSALIKRLLEFRHVHILSIDNYSSGLKKNELRHHPRVSYQNDEARNIAQYNSSFRPQCVFHLGEFSRINQSFADPTLVFRSNLWGTSSVIEFCATHGYKLFYTASSAIFNTEVSSPR